MFSKGILSKIHEGLLHTITANWNPFKINSFHQFKFKDSSHKPGRYWSAENLRRNVYSITVVFAFTFQTMNVLKWWWKVEEGQWQNRQKPAVKVLFTELVVSFGALSLSLGLLVDLQIYYMIGPFQITF